MSTCLFEWVDLDGEVHQTVSPPNPCETRLPVRRVKAVPYGYHWEVVHESSGEVVNSGFTQTDPPNAGPLSDLKGFSVRVTPVKRMG